MGGLAIGYIKANTFSSSVASSLFFSYSALTQSFFGLSLLYFFSCLVHYSVYHSHCGFFIPSPSFITMLPMKAHSTSRIFNWPTKTFYCVYAFMNTSKILKMWLPLVIGIIPPCTLHSLWTLHASYYVKPTSLTISDFVLSAIDVR